MEKQKYQGQNYIHIVVSRNYSTLFTNYKQIITLPTIFYMGLF